MEKEYSKMQVEDKALKSAAVYFGQELLPYLKIKGKIKRLLPTEQIRLEAVRSTEDILFEMEDGRLTHFEFESVEVTANEAGGCGQAFGKAEKEKAAGQAAYKEGFVAVASCTVNERSKYD